MWMGENSNRKDVIGMSSKFTTKLLLLSVFVFVLIGSTVYSVSTGIFGGGAGVAEAFEVGEPVGVTLKCVDTFGNPRADIKMIVCDEVTYDEIAEVTTNEHGIATANLEDGSYTISFVTPNILCGETLFTVSDGKVLVGNKEVTEIEMEISFTEPESFDVKVIKVDENGKTLAGADLSIWDIDDKEFAYQWETDESGEKIVQLDSGVAYRLEEHKAPGGYTKANAIEFTLNADGKLECTDETVINNEGEVPTLIMVNKKIVETATNSEIQEQTQNKQEESVDNSADDDSQAAYSIATGENNTSYYILFVIAILSAFSAFAVSKAKKYEVK